MNTLPDLSTPCVEPPTAEVAHLIVTNCAYGDTVPITWFETQFGAKEGKWRFTGPMIRVRSLLKLQGRKLSRIGRDGVYVVLHKESLVRVAAQQAKTAVRTLGENAKMLNAISRTGMESDAIRRMDYWQNKTAFMHRVATEALTMQEIPEGSNMPKLLADMLRNPNKKKKPKAE